jgi:MFS family permease
MFSSAPGQSFFLALFVDHLIQDANVSRAGFAVLYALATVVSAITAFQVGHAVDQVGVRRVWPFVAAGLALACLLLSLATSPLLVLVALSLARGFGQGSFPVLGTVLVASRTARRGRAMGIATQGVNLAGIVLPVAAAVLIGAVGWRSALRIIALLVAALVIPLALFLHRRHGQSGGVASPPLPAGFWSLLRAPGALRLVCRRWRSPPSS